MYYNCVYKHGLIKLDCSCLFLEYAFDNTLGLPCFTVKTNISFLDENGEFSPCVGVGNDEETAIEDLFAEIEALPFEGECGTYNRGVLLHSIDIPRKIEKITLPCKTTIRENDGKSGTFYYLRTEYGIDVLTETEKIKTRFLDLREMIGAYQGKLLQSNDVFPNAFLREQLFYPTFEKLCY